MRQISPATNLVLACLAALGLLGTLSLPWYAPPVPDTNEWDGPVERTAFAIAHVFKHHDAAVSGGDVLGGAQTLMFILAALVVVLCGVASIPAMRAHVRDVLRVVAIGAPLLVFYLAVDHPGRRDLDIHWGLLVALGVALFMANAVWHGSAIRVKRVPTGTWERRPAA